MPTIVIKIGATASRRLDWQSVLLQGETVSVRVEDPRETGALEDASAADCFLAVATYGGTLIGVAGPFEEVLGPTPEGGGDAPVIAWEAELSLGNDDAAAALADLGIGERRRLWSGLLDTAHSYAMGTGSAIVEGAPFVGAGGSVPTLPGSYVSTGAFADIDVTTPATLSSLRAQLAAILAALKGE